jgi:hypothetical protein
MPAVTRPMVVLAGRPAAEWTTDSRAGRFAALSLIGLAINNTGGLVVREGAHETTNENAQAHFESRHVKYGLFPS